MPPRCHAGADHLLLPGQVRPRLGKFAWPYASSETARLPEMPQAVATCDLESADVLQQGSCGAVRPHSPCHMHLWLYLKYEPH